MNNTLRFVPVGVLMDLFLLCGVQLTLGSLRIRRTTYALIVLLIHDLVSSVFPCFMAIPWMIAACIIVSVILMYPCRLRRIAESCICLLGLTAACAGFAGITTGDLKSSLSAGIAGTLILLLLIRRNRHISRRWNIEIFVERDGVSATFPALIDTGNLLKEHRSGLPVLIVEVSAMQDLAEHINDLHKKEIRTLSFGVLGSSGEIPCFRADCLRMRLQGEKWTRAPECWVAVFHGRIPGRTCALAPPQFADYTAETPVMFVRIQNTFRRFCYVVFKRKTIHLWPGSAISPGFRLLHRGK